MKSDEPIIGISPEGQELKFASIADASNILGLNYCSVWRVVHGQRLALKGWKFIWYSPSHPDCEEIEPTDPLETRRHGDKPRGKDVKTLMEGHDEYLYEGRKCIGKGYFMEGMMPSICPICGMVIADRDPDNIREHLHKCIAGRDFSYRHGIIKVYE